MRMLARYIKVVSVKNSFGFVGIPTFSPDSLDILARRDRLISYDGVISYRTKWMLANCTKKLGTLDEEFRLLYLWMKVFRECRDGKLGMQNSGLAIY